MANSFKPGKVWLDTDGKKIQAHGGSVIFFKGTYYWYGENKEFTLGKDKTWTSGIRCYSSQNLYDWKDEGLIIPPSQDPASPLFPERKIDRPHILYNEKTKKFVCWIKIMNEDGTQAMTVLTSDALLGGYEIVRTNYRPLDMNSGDFDLVKDDNGKAYIYFGKVHTELICADLTEDYTAVTGKYSSHFPSRLPYAREAPAYFKRNNNHYLITSGTTGYFPNPSEVAVGKDYHGPFTVLGNPHRYDGTNTSFHSQISCVFKVEGKKDLYIAMADRWMPEHMHVKYEDLEQIFSLFIAGKQDEAIKIMAKLNMPDNTNTSISTYVWLPLRFEGENVYIDWLDEWLIEDFE